MAKLYTTYIRESSEETAELDYLLTGTGSEKKQQKASLLEIQLKSALSPVAFVDTQEIVLPTDYMTTEQKFTYEKMTSEVMAAARGIETNYQDAFNLEYNWTPSNYYRELLGDDFNFIELAFDKEGSQLDKLINAIVNDPLGTVHTVLDAVGMIPGIGEVFDGVNGLLYLAEGNTLYAGLSATSMIPIFGMGATGGKYLAKYGDEAVSIVKGTDKAVANGNKIFWGSWDNYSKVTVNGQEYAQVGDRLYSRHAVDRMQPSGNRYGSSITQAGGDYGRSVAPQYVEDVINSMKPVLQENGNLSYTSGSLQVITNQLGAVVTIITK